MERIWFYILLSNMQEVDINHILSISSILFGENLSYLLWKDERERKKMYFKYQIQIMHGRYKS